MEQKPYLAVLSAVAAILLVAYLLIGFGRRKAGMPPGPPTAPVIGNLHQIPATGMYKKYKQYRTRRLIQANLIPLGSSNGQVNMGPCFL